MDSNGTRRSLAEIVRGRGDAVSSAVLAAVGGFIVFQASRWEYSGEAGPGPGFFPVWYGLAILVISLGLLVASLRGAAPPRPAESGAGGIGRALFSWAAFSACIALFEWLGFVIAFALFSFVIMTAIYRRPAMSALVSSAALSAGFYAFFALALKVSLPAGALGF